jgi:hypothetical protein
MNLETEQRHLQDAPHCLLLWRTPLPDLDPAAAFLSESIKDSMVRTQATQP